MSNVEDARFTSDLLRHVPRLRAFARFLTGEHARGEDLAQEALARAWRGRRTFAADTNMEAWLFRILRNTHISGVRRARRGEEEDLELFSWRLASNDDPGAGLRLNDLRRALNRLPHDQREALLLVGAGGWSYEEAALYAECPVGTMKSRVFRARRALAAAVDRGDVLPDRVHAHEAMDKLLRRVRSAERGRDARAEGAPDLQVAV